MSSATEQTSESQTSQIRRAVVLSLKGAAILSAVFLVFIWASLLLDLAEFQNVTSAAEDTAGDGGEILAAQVLGYSIEDRAKFCLAYTAGTLVFLSAACVVANSLGAHSQNRKP